MSTTRCPPVGVGSESARTAPARIRVQVADALIVVTATGDLDTATAKLRAELRHACGLCWGTVVPNLAGTSGRTEGACDSCLRLCGPADDVLRPVRESRPGSAVPLWSDDGYPP